MAAHQLRIAATADEVVGPLCDAFTDYPVMRYVLGPEGDYRARLEILVRNFLLARVLRKDPILALCDGDEVCGVAVCTLPGLPSTPDLEEAREWSWSELGGGAKERYGDWIRVWEPLGVAEPNIHVNMLGVPPKYQGRGFGKVLLERVYAMSREHAESTGISLTTESEGNVSFYQRMGYQLLGHARIRPGFETWSFFRPN